MSHAVTVTRTTTTVHTTSAILLNTGYLKTFPGLLKLTQLIVGAVVVGLIGHYIQYYQSNSSYQAVLFIPELFFLIVSSTCLITTACLLISCLVSISTATIISKTTFEVIYHGVASLLYLAASICLLVVLTKHTNKYYLHYYDAVLAAAVSVFSIPSTVMYFCASVLLLREIASRNLGYQEHEYGYGDKMFAGCMGLVNTVLYFISSFLAIRSYRG